MIASGRDTAREKVSRAASPHQLPQVSYYHIQSLLIAPFSKGSVQNFCPIYDNASARVSPI